MTRRIGLHEILTTAAHSRDGGLTFLDKGTPESEAARKAITLAERLGWLTYAGQAAMNGKLITNYFLTAAGRGIIAASKRAN